MCVLWGNEIYVPRSGWDDAQVGARRTPPLSLSKMARGKVAAFGTSGWFLVKVLELILVWGPYEVGDLRGRTWGRVIDEVGGVRGLCHRWGEVIVGHVGFLVMWWSHKDFGGVSWFFGGQVSGVGELCGVVFMVFKRCGGVYVVWEYYCGVSAEVYVRSGNTVSVTSKYLKVLPLVLQSINKERESI